MPSRWQVRLSVHPRHVEWQQLHGAISTVLGHRDDGATDFALCPPEMGPESTTTLEIRLLTDEEAAVHRLVESMTAAQEAGGLMIGRKERQDRRAFLRPLSPVTMGPLALLEAAPWSQLHATHDAVSRFTMHFLSPYFARSGRTVMPVPLPGSVLKSLERHWATHAPAFSLGVRTRSLETTITALRGETVTIQMDRRSWTGFTGTVDYEVVTGEAPERIALGRLLRSARFTGVGSSVAYGFGVVEVE